MRVKHGQVSNHIDCACGWTASGPYTIETHLKSVTTAATECDRSPIDQRWIQQYCDEFLKVAQTIPEGVFRDTVLRRVECVMDLLEAWQKRNEPKA